uniref:B3 domain-containing protein Os01g0234100-like isoform X2 n=1 Tax=Erigeron canadensis TaxID=72917 RepID=UPI001CB945E0|nr:B3 domain-containing protein Os01g0234100-like isoform X2 [Erigeron canadensis]
MLLYKVTSNPPSSGLSLQRGKSQTKVFKTQVLSSPAMIQALEVQSSLGSEFPSCIKTMVRSQVTSGFWMGLPSNFCETFLPNKDAIFVLEDEERKHFNVKYIANKFGISAGWKKFAIGHTLTEGDVLLFHLIKTTKFKVYIFKANSREVDGALALLNLDAHTEESTPGNDVETITLSPEKQSNKHPESLSFAVVPMKRKRSAPSSRSAAPSRPSGHFIQQSGNESEEVGSEVLEVYKPLKPKLSFREVKSFEDFHIVVKGICIDRELPYDVRFGYYKLCFYRKQFLHHSLREDMYDKLVVGMIGEIVGIANKIKNCKFTTTKKEFEEWDKSLKFFELMGMKVDFLLDKMNTLARLLFESEGVGDVKKYLKAKIDQEHIEEEIKMVAAKLRELKESTKKAEEISSILKQKVDNFEYRLKKEVDTPW